MRLPAAHGAATGAPPAPHGAAPCGATQPRPRRRVIARLSDISSVTESFGLLLKPEVAAVLSTGVAAMSAVWGASLAEEKKARLEKDLELERRARMEMSEMVSIMAKYRGPLLESCVDLEQRFWHALTRTGEWTPGLDSLCFEEVSYTLFTIAQLLGFMEVCRREGPRERNFLDEGSLAGSDTLFTLLEGMRFVMCASPATLQAWGCEGDARDHPGARERRYVVLRSEEEEACLLPAHGAQIPLRISRGMQRAIGAMMVSTPMGAKRHYTMSYADFVVRLKSDAAFAAWFQPLEESLAELLTGPCWDGQGPFPCHRWTRVLLLQQLLVEAFDLLDHKCLRIMPSRRMRLAPVAYKPLPNLEAYQARLTLLSGGGNSSSNYEALANLRDPLAVARRGGAVAGGGSPAPGSPWLPPWAAAAQGGGSGGKGAGGSPGARTAEGGSALASVDFEGFTAALSRVADDIKALNGNGGGGARGGNGAGNGRPSGMPLLASKLPPSRGGSPAADSAEPVVPLADVAQQLRTPHAAGGAGGRPDGEALLQDVIGASMLQRLQQAQGPDSNGGGAPSNGANGNGNGASSSNGAAPVAAGAPAGGISGGGEAAGGSPGASPGSSASGSLASLSSLSSIDSLDSASGAPRPRRTHRPSPVE